MAYHDPFAFITDLCHISSSQEAYLRRSCFAGEIEDPDSEEEQVEFSELHVESTGITILSAPESLEEKEYDCNSQQDLFHTPPEGSVLASSDGQRSSSIEPAIHDSQCSQAVDLGRDTDLGFTDMEMAQRRENISVATDDREQELEVIHSQSNTSVPITKLSKFGRENLRVGASTGENIEKGPKSVESLNSPLEKSMENTVPETPSPCLPRVDTKPMHASASPNISAKHIWLGGLFSSPCVEVERRETNPVQSTSVKELEILDGNLEFKTPIVDGTANLVAQDIHVDTEKLKSGKSTMRRDSSEEVLLNNSNTEEGPDGESSAKRKLNFFDGESRIRSREVSTNQNDTIVKRICDPLKDHSSDDYQVKQKKSPVTFTGKEVEMDALKGDGFCQDTSASQKNSWDTILFAIRKLEKFRSTHPS